MRQCLGSGRYLVGPSGHLLRAQVDLSQRIAEIVIDGLDRLENGIERAYIHTLVLGMDVKVSMRHLLQQAAFIADHAAQNLLTGPQCLTHITQFIFALKLHRDIKLTLAEAHQGLMYLSCRLHNASNQLCGHHQDDRCGDHHHYDDYEHRDLAGALLLVNRRLLRLV